MSYFIFFFFLSFSTSRTVYNEFVLATFNLMFETYGNYYQSACGPLLIVTSCWFRNTFLLRLVWSDKFLPGMFGRRCCRSCTRSVGCKCSQGCCRICCWMTRSWKCNCHLLLRMKAHSMSQRIWNVLCMLELYFPAWGSLTGAHPGLFTSENKNALESYWCPLLESIREKLTMKPSLISAVCSDTHFRN